MNIVNDNSYNNNGYNNESHLDYIYLLIIFMEEGTEKGNAPRARGSHNAVPADIKYLV